MLREYDCWLQNRKKNTFYDSLNPEFNAVYVIGMESSDLIFNQAVEELRTGLLRLFGFSPAIYPVKSGGNDKKAEEKKGIFLGTRENLKNLFNLPMEKMAPSSFMIKSIDKNLIITGEDAEGILYGVFRFLFLVVLKTENKSRDLSQGSSLEFDIREEPSSPIRMINHWDNINGTIERGYAGSSIFFKDDKIVYEKERVKDYARLLSSIGINALSFNNVNVRGAARMLITEEMLPDAAAIAAIFRPFGIKLFISVNFNSPIIIGKLPVSDPLDPGVIEWWKNQTDLVYSYIPDLGGFLIKADSEGQPGPFQYGRNHADGANTLARALKPHGGLIIWRCFVYNAAQDWRDRTQDRPKAAYDNFLPLDGSFDDNVILQPKYGTLDFQVGEPVAPMFGAFKKTRHIMELQITQEYTGHQIDLCFLPTLWEGIMDFNTDRGPNSQIRELVGNYREGSSFIEGFAAVVNIGLDNNWTGHTLAQANLYGYGRMIWDPSLKASDIAREWCLLSFGSGKTSEIISAILLKSYRTYEKYIAPFGVGFMVTPGSHYGPNIEGYEYSRWGTYHRADTKAIGVDRTSSGTGYTDQYSPSVAAMFANPSSCPDENLLFIHRLPYDFIMKNGESLLQNIYNTHFEGYDEVFALMGEWKKLKDSLEEEVYNSVLSRFERQLSNAREWRDQINTYFFRRSGIGDKKGRQIYG